MSVQIQRSNQHNTASKNGSKMYPFLVDADAGDEVVTLDKVGMRDNMYESLLDCLEPRVRKT